MITVQAETSLKGKKLVLEMPGVPDGDYQVVVVLQPVRAKHKLNFGFMKGKITMSEDFNEPIEDFKDYQS